MTVGKASPEDSGSRLPDGRLDLSTRLSLADAVTAVNASCGAGAIYSTYWVRSDSRFEFGVSILLLLSASLLDVLDGFIARRFRSSRCGMNFDNVADYVSFGLAPSVIVLRFFAPGSWMAAAVALLMAGAVAKRLYRFATDSASRAQPVFIGLPAPMCAFSCISIVFIHMSRLLALACFLGVAGLTVSRFKYPKARGMLAFAIFGGALVGGAFVALWMIHVPLATTGASICAISQLIAVGAMTIFFHHPSGGIRPSVGDATHDA